MIVLQNITDSLEIVLSGAVATNQLPFVVTYVDSTTTAYSPLRTTGLTNDTTAVTMVASPAASTSRTIKYFSVYNKDTVQSIVTIQYNNNTVLSTIAKITLAVGDRVEYTSEEGIRVFDLNGSLKQTAAISGYEPTITAGTTAQYWRGDKSWQTLDKSAVGLGNVDNTSDSTKNSATVTLTNKRLTPRVQSVTSSATVTPSADNDDAVKITAQAAALTLANPTGTPTAMQCIIIRIKDNGTARAISYDTLYRAVGITLPTTTVINKTTYLGLIYNSDDTKWDVIGVSTEA